MFEEYLKDAFKTCPDLVYKAHITRGDPRKELLDAAAKVRADYIVMGKRGLSALESVVLGSTSNYLVKVIRSVFAL